MVGSSSGLSPYVFAKQPFSVTYTCPSGIHATKSSCTGSEPFCRVNVVVVLPVPDRPTVRHTFSPASVGMILQPACSGRPPRSYTSLFHIRRPPFFDSDYFGESKKGGLRMWNKLVYDRGGLPLHAGCKVIPTDEGEMICLTVGLSGTGKTTTTFTKQNGSLPVQDDFVAWMADG